MYNASDFAWVAMLRDPYKKAYFEKVIFEAPLTSSLIIKKGFAENYRDKEHYLNPRVLKYVRDSEFPLNHVLPSIAHDKVEKNVPLMGFGGHKGLLFTDEFANEAKLQLSKFDGFHEIAYDELAPDGTNTAIKVSETWAASYGFRRPALCQFSIKHELSKRFKQADNQGVFTVSFYIKLLTDDPREFFIKSSTTSLTAFYSITKNSLTSTSLHSKDKLKIRRAANGYHRVELYGVGNWINSDTAKGEDRHTIDFWVSHNKSHPDYNPNDAYAEFAIWGFQVSRGMDALPYVDRDSPIKRGTLTIPYAGNMPNGGDSFRISFLINAAAMPDDSHYPILIFKESIDSGRNKFYFARSGFKYVFVYCDDYYNPANKGKPCDDVEHYAAYTTQETHSTPVHIILEYVAEDNVTRIFHDSKLQGECRNHGVKSRDYAQGFLESMHYPAYDGEDSYQDSIYPYYISDLKILRK